ncbi:NAD(P) transhydrogenase subunit alpha [Acrocarpospora sp. B8E8]|uniref:NAD(P) transhydrogenase subunit alpha n=1 Tax=Acrocarpospora sp. B8E8 TaxID=3153572 RepID=UPI00325D04CB
MNALTVGVVKEAAAGERRVALIPDAVARLRDQGFNVLVESRAGTAAWFPDTAYAQAGAVIVTHAELYDQSDVIVAVRRPPTAGLAPGKVVIGMLRPFADPKFAAEAADLHVTAIAFEGLPRRLSAAQPMDALTSQDNIAGYKAAILTADSYDRFFPLLVTAAGTARPARVLVLGAGVAGLQAISTVRRLGAVVTGYDIRLEAQEEIASLGASFLDLGGPAAGAGSGGYARALDTGEQRSEQDGLAARIGDYDVVITTARVPGRRPPLLVTETAVKAMAAGSIVADLAAGELGGNVEMSQPGQTIVTENGVTVIGDDELAARMPVAASTAYSSNVRALLKHLVQDGVLTIDLADEIQAGVVVTHAGAVVHPLLAGTSSRGRS